MHSDVTRLSWTVSPGDRRQIGMVKVPLAIAERLRLHDGQQLTVEVRAGRRLLYVGPLTVTSGQELYIPRRVQTVVGSFHRITFLVG